MNEEIVKDFHIVSEKLVKLRGEITKAEFKKTPPNVLKLISLYMLMVELYDAHIVDSTNYLIRGVESTNAIAAKAAVESAKNSKVSADAAVDSARANKEMLELMRGFVKSQKKK